MAQLLEAPFAHQVLSSMTARQKPDAAILAIENYAGNAFNNITCLRELKPQDSKSDWKCGKMTKMVGRLCRVLATLVFREEALGPVNHPVNAAKGWNHRECKD